jgi:hypothetical protein
LAKGKVGTPEEIEKGEWEVIVSGSEDYIVKIQIKNNVVEDFTCSVETSV